MALTKTEFYRYQFEGCKAYWDIKHDSLKKINGEEFVTIPQHGLSHGFARVMAEKCHTLPVNYNPKTFSLTSSIGYKKLLDLRYEVHREAMKQEAEKYT